MRGELDLACMFSTRLARAFNPATEYSHEQDKTEQGAKHAHENDDVIKH